LRKQGAGGLTLAGDSSGFTGTTTVSAGLLRGDGLLGGRVSVEDGATLGGAGTVGGDVTVSGGTLSGEQGRSLEMACEQARNAGGRVAAPLAASGAWPRFRVDGDLSLEGTLDSTDAGGSGAGTYRLFDYGGTRGGNGLAFGEMPDGADPGRL